MRHAKNKKGKDRVTATIVLCFCLIALTSIFTIQSSIDKVNDSAKKLPVDQKMVTKDDPAGPESNAADSKTPAKNSSTEPGAADLPVSKEHAIVDSAINNSENKPTEAQAYLPPMSLSTASVSKDYSMDMVIYNKTLDQYMTHPGIDLEAPSGSGVHAIADGTVTGVYKDDAYGTAIEITHSNGLISKYACLETAAMVEQGDTVSQGQKISTIGKTALYESLEAAHLHFEVYKDGKLCNPSDYIAFE